MNKVAILLAAILCLGAGIFRTALGEEVKRDEELTKKIDECLTEIKKIKVGMTRAELLKVFTTEGGFYTSRDRQFVWKKCPYIKVYIKFKARSDVKDALKESDDDIIAEISRPYLELSISD